MTGVPNPEAPQIYFLDGHTQGTIYLPSPDAQLAILNGAVKAGELPIAGDFTHDSETGLCFTFDGDVRQIFDATTATAFGNLLSKVGLHGEIDAYWEVVSGDPDTCEIRYLCTPGGVSEAQDGTDV